MTIKRAPFFQCFLQRSDDDYDAGFARYVALARALTAFSPDTAGWQVYRSVAEGQTGGIMLVDDPEAAQAFQMKRGYNDNSNGAPYRANTEFARDGFFAKKALKYKWRSQMLRDTLELALDAPRLFEGDLSLDRFLQLADILWQFQPMQYLFVGDRKYWTDQRHLYAPDRVPAGWFCWVPQAVTQTQIPSAYLVEPRYGGTLIVTQRAFFNINDNAAATQRANAVEFEMNELGILPELRVLNHDPV